AGAATQGLDELPLEVVDADLPDGGVRDVQPVPGVVDGHTAGITVELAVAVDADRGAGGVVLQDPVVHRVGQPEVAGGVDVDAVDTWHVGGCGAGRPDVERLRVLAVGQPPHAYLGAVGRVVGVVAVRL